MTRILEKNKIIATRVKRNYQITIPQNLRKKFDVDIGDYVEVDIKPVKLISADQEYFHTKEWQKGEAGADKDIAEGRVAGPFNSVKDLVKELKN